MVRTRADAGSTKVSAAKAPRKSLSSASSSSSPCRSGSSKDRYSGGNSYNPQPIPQWQKGISSFLQQGSSSSKENESSENDIKEEDSITTSDEKNETSTSSKNAEDKIISES